MKINNDRKIRKYYRIRETIGMVLQCLVSRIRRHRIFIVRRFKKESIFFIKFFVSFQSQKFYKATGAVTPSIDIIGFKL